MSPDRSKAARELLAFYAEAGVDTAGAEQAHDFLPAPEPLPAPSPAAAASPRTVDPRLVPVPAKPAAPPSPTPDAAVMAAREAARSAASLDELRAILDRFDGCSLKGSASRLVFAD